MSLTGRQRDFLNQFLDLYRQMPKSLHYTAVAEALGVSSITAYDMLRLLEERGLVESKYVLPKQRRGSGRSSIVFRPTQQAYEMIPELAADTEDPADWERAKNRILEAVARDEEHNYQRLIEEFLSRPSADQNPMVYAAEMITATLLSLQQLGQEALSRMHILARTDSFRLPSETILNAMGGIMIGLSFAERLNRRWLAQLISYQERYQEIVARLGTEKQKELVSFARSVVRIISGS